VGFIAGALAGYGLGQAAGWNIFDAGYGATSLLGIVCVGLGGGLGLQLARRWRAAAPAAQAAERPEQPSPASFSCARCWTDC
jgi:hypothetical protein